MIVFLLPLKSVQMSTYWNSVCQLFERTVRSICRQTDSSFQLVVICHETPNIQFHHSAIHYINVDFSPPTNREILYKRMDRIHKTMIGLKYARRFSPNHVMFVDADDCISSRIAAFANQHPETDGWYVNSGYVYQEGSRWIYYRKSAFNKWCGTSHIIRFDCCPFFGENMSYEELFEFLMNHRNFPNKLKQKGMQLQPLPFPGTVYTIGHGDNTYQSGWEMLHNSNRGKIFFKIKEMLKFRPLSRSLREEFGLYPLSF
jgi:hypothetical protein